MNAKLTYLSLFCMTTLSLFGCGSEAEETLNPEPGPEPEVKEASTEIIYQANPRLFATDNCLQATSERIPQIADMGFSTLWLMPVNSQGELNGIGSPYCVSDYKGINTRYGTAADLTNLVATAHANGLKVILDWVPNHTSWDHTWTSTHPDWYVKDADGKFLSPNGWTDVIQLDYSNAGLREEMVESLIYWIREADIDGYRFDYATGIPHVFWRNTLPELRKQKEGLLLLAETGDFSFYEDGFDMIYDWDLNASLSKAFTDSRISGYFADSEKSLSKVPEGKSILRYAFNHDVAAENDMSRFFGSPEAIPAAYVLTAMLDGTPMVYSSMEAESIPGKLSFFTYTPLKWSKERQNIFKAINNAYKKSAPVRNGKLRTYDIPGAAIFTRSTEDHNLLVIVNTTGESRNIKTPMTLTGMEMTDLIAESPVKISSSLALPPYGYLILMN